VGGHEYLKIGWIAYDTSWGYGWTGDIDDYPKKYEHLGISGPNVLQQSIIYDDWGRPNVFEFDLPNAIYNVTVSAGWQNKTYDRQYIAIEGVNFVNDESNNNGYLVRTNQVTVTDNKITMEMGIFDEYTMLNYLDIEYVSSVPIPGAVWLLGSGLIGLVGLRKKLKK